ncbi:MAG: copper chaperone PCu(A)C [Proteobacteria bacterium]|jgi:periplasmic copper chaperone A|nr:copper chaperone PCu(A)C [Pseudomonadota bacterium]
MKPLMILAAAFMLLAPTLSHASMETRLGDLIITGAWTRATPTRAPTGAGFVTIENKGSSDDRLIAVRTSISGKSEIHTMTMDNGVMRMRQLEDGIAIPAGGTVTLQPGGNHLMFMQLKQGIAQDTAVPVTLVFEKAGEVTLDFLAAPVGSLKPAEMHHKH